MRMTATRLTADYYSFKVNGSNELIPGGRSNTLLDINELRQLQHKRTFATY